MPEFRYHDIGALTIDEVLKRLETASGGPSPEEARQRLVQFGANQLTEPDRYTILRGLTRHFTHFLALLLWIASGLAFAADFMKPGEGMATLGWAILGVIVINAVFAFFQEYKAERAVQALHRLLPDKAWVLRAGQAAEIARLEIVPGDVLILEEGERIPADARLIEAVVAMSGFFLYLYSQRWTWGAQLDWSSPLYKEATTVTFAGIVLAQVANVFACRSDRLSAARSGWFSNPVILLGIAIELTLLAPITYTPTGHEIFGTSPCHHGSSLRSRWAPSCGYWQKRLVRS